MTATWLASYAYDPDHTTVATLADPVAIAIERGYGRGYGDDADGRSREAYLRQMDADAEREAANAERAEASAAREQAREALRRQMLGVDRKWFWDFAIGVRDDLIAQRSEALLRRDHFAHASIDRRLEQLETDLVKIERLQVLWEHHR